MQMNPTDYFNNFVKPNYEEFCNDAGSIRKAFNAIVSLVHMTDNYYQFYKRRNDNRVAGFSKLEDFQIHLSTLTSHFNDVQSMANAYKHLYTNSGKAHVTVASGGAVYVNVEEDGEELIDSESFDATYSSCVWFLTKDGDHKPVEDALDAVIDMWKNIVNE